MSEQFHLGALTDASHEATDEPAHLDADHLTTHGVIVGMTGSGKTGLGIVTMEEALRHGIPCLVIDPKGDLTNLLLTFPELSAADFAPWVPTTADAADVAATWTDGLARWGLGGPAIAALRSGAEMTVYTPGSGAGVPLNLVGAMTPPKVAPDADLDEAWADEIESICQGLLGLVGLTSDVMAGREHVLMANLVRRAWDAGEGLDLAGLISQIADPPVRKLGVIDIDEFFPPGDRRELALTLNGLLASPAFAGWSKGDALDISSLLRTVDGRPRVSVIYLAHLSDAERQWAIARILAALVTWMRAQGGSPALRALLYIDEVMGFVPPTANPPSKKPILTIAKQARAFGVGMLLSTQNPVDLDYKALSNAGTWMIGRLQTERDKSRLADGLDAASGAVDTAALSNTISALEPREFVMHTTEGRPPVTFTVRWAMSYLAGPITKERIRELPGQPSRADAPPSPAPLSPAPPSATAPAASTAPATAPAAAPADEVATMPTVADGVAVRWLDPAAPWASQIGSDPASTRFDAAVAVRAQLTFDEDDVRIDDEWEAVFFPLSDAVDAAAAIAVDFDERDLRETVPAGSTYVTPTAAIDTASWFAEVERSVKDHLYRTQSAAVATNPTLRLTARPGEDAAGFAARCAAEAERRADEDADALRKKIAARLDRVRDAIERDEQKAADARDRASSSRHTELISGAGSVLGALLGGRRSVRSIAGSVSRAARGRERVRQADSRVEAALARADTRRVELAELEAELAEDLVDIDERWAAAARELGELSIRPEKADISISAVHLVWVPVPRPAQT